jgi:hypothetical protein
MGLNSSPFELDAFDGIESSAIPQEAIQRHALYCVNETCPQRSFVLGQCF